MYRIVILTSGSGGTAAQCLPKLADTSGVEVVAVVRAQGMNPTTKWKRRKSKVLKALKIGPIGAFNGVRIRKWYHAENPPLEDVCRETGVKLTNVPYIGSKETEEAFKNAEADIGLSLGNSFIPERVFSVPKHGMLNFHGERLPKYQNAQSVIWPIFNSETLTGITLHRVASGIDEGDIFYEETFPIRFHPTLRETVEHTLVETNDRTTAAISRVCANLSEFLEARTPQIAGTKYTTPSFRQFRQMERNNHRLFLDRVSGEN